MKAVLMDREGTLIVDPPFDRVDALEKIRLLADTLAGLELLAKHGYGIIIITNQTNIVQGRITEQGFWDLHDEIIRLIEPSGINIFKTYVCPHNAEENCICRKPKPALLLNAIRDFDLTPGETFMVGDRDTDIIAGINAGTQTILVKTGKHPTRSADACYIAENLLDAAKYIVSFEDN
ncbi:MAG TPA: HAD-IIIA family hydrolase [Candidatus Saccharimonadales bacterium]|nr:HAD-IIIA family hydrolase [Candidatus Saccharimonadales bacterium]